MTKQIELDKYYMSLALRVAELSHGVRAKVGACLVTENDVTILSCNGLPEALGNQLEYIVDTVGGGKNVLGTKHEVIHAELNSILKCAKEGVSVKGATIYTTLSCCSQCASMLASCGVKRVVFLEEYRDTKGIEILEKCGIVVEKLDSVF